MKNTDTASGKKFNSLVARISANEKGALEEFYTAYGKLIYAAALTIVPQNTADEVVDDVLAKIWRGAASLGKIKKPVGWLYTVTVNSAKDRVRSEKSVAEIYEISYTDKNIEEIISDDSFYCYIKGLDADEQEILILRFIEDMTFKQIAKELSRPLNTVTSAYYRALKKIKEKIEKDAKK